jgi:hypothetical protein
MQLLKLEVAIVKGGNEVGGSSSSHAAAYWASTTIPAAFGTQSRGNCIQARSDRA